MEMWKHLDALRSMGSCTIVSAAGKPVGAGWSREALATIEAKGFDVKLREYELSRLSFLQWWGILYGALAKGVGLESAFGHKNPYHRHAFPADWWLRQTEGMDLAVINYSYWSALPCACPKAVVLHDLFSSVMVGGMQEEVKDLKTAGLVIAISRMEEDLLKTAGLKNVLWSPPIMDAAILPDSKNVGLVGSGNRMNREGLIWMAGANAQVNGIRVYGGVARFCKASLWHPIGAYPDDLMPYRDCGIMLMTTTLGSGVQIKGIEALAAGRAIIARRGAMRGIPEGNGAWIEVETPGEMLREVERLQGDNQARLAQMAAAYAYYHKYLDANLLRANLRDAYADLGRKYA